MRIDYNWYWIRWDETTQEWIFEWKSDEMRKECLNNERTVLDDQ